EADVAEGERRAAGGFPLHPAPLLFPVLDFRWHQHGLTRYARSEDGRRKTGDVSHHPCLSRRSLPRYSSRSSTVYPLPSTGSGGLSPGLGFMLLAAVDPGLDPDLPVRRVGLGEPVVDVGLQRVEREAPLLVPLRAGDFRPVQPAGAADLDPLGAEAQGRLDPLLHRAPERHAALELQGDRLGDELGVRLRPLDLDDVDVDLGLGPLLELVAQLVHFRAALADDDPRPGGLDVDLHPVGEPLDVHLGDACVREAALQLLAELDVLVQERLVLLGREPARVPGAVETEPETVRMNFLTHAALPLPLYAFASDESESSIVRWLLRWRTRKARPIGAGRMRRSCGPLSTVIFRTTSSSTSSCVSFCSAL